MALNNWKETVNVRQREGELMSHSDRIAVLMLGGLMSACGTSGNSECEQMWDYWRPRVIAAAATNLPLPIVPGQSVGPVALGMPRAEVEQALGPPQRVAFGAWEYPTLGLAIGFEKDRVSGISAGSGTCGDPERLLEKAFAGQFAEGVGMGATKREVFAVLGEPLGRGATHENFEMLMFHNMDLGFEDGRLSWMRIVLPEEPGEEDRPGARGGQP